jgi:hypothetical protein
LQRLPKSRLAAWVGVVDHALRLARDERHVQRCDDAVNFMLSSFSARSEMRLVASINSSK